MKNALRMRPDRIVVGEVRGPEALDMLTALSTGHDGSLCTVHAGSAAEALRRLETLALMADVGLPHAAIREQVADAIDLVVCQARASRRQPPRRPRSPRSCAWPAAPPRGRSTRSGPAARPGGRRSARTWPRGWRGLSAARGAGAATAAARHGRRAAACGASRPSPPGAG